MFKVLAVHMHHKSDLRCQGTRLWAPVLPQDVSQTDQSAVMARRPASLWRDSIRRSASAGTNIEEANPGQGKPTLFMETGSRAMPAAV